MTSTYRCNRSHSHIFFRNGILHFLEPIISFIKKHPFIWDKVLRLKVERKRLVGLSYYLYDAKNTYLAMHWPAKHHCINTLSAELVFQYHKLEKGLVMPGKKRMFGINPAKETMRLLDNWQSIDREQISDPIFLAGIGTLQCYIAYLKTHNLDIDDQITSEAEHFLTRHSDQRNNYPTPSKRQEYYNPQEFKTLTLARRSVRAFIDKPVPKEIIIQSYEAAQQSPSACNRQPCSVKIISDPDLKREVLGYQNGNAGFGQLMDSVAIITSNEKYFFGGIERHQPYVDGGLFSMSFILGLQSHGVSTCCLNWCVRPENDKAVHKLLNLEKSERIIMYLAIGYAPADLDVATSTRRRFETTLEFKSKKNK